LDYPKRFGFYFWVIFFWPNGSFFWVEILEFNFVYVFGLNPKMGMDFMGFDLDENLGFMVIFWE